ncbi:unnamed protein product [Dimorphilus gyrociliatus]|uniref:Uncharacterized protein n=1 Tax=Dimorphilus gyrociliatus TaxID=2664684 RepID=A0A7I8VJ51_9ANNE|nr:unnamed protein product [Dimorphilus gyrociliatus]
MEIGEESVDLFDCDANSLTSTSVLIDLRLENRVNQTIASHRNLQLYIRISKDIIYESSDRKSVKRWKETDLSILLPSSGFSDNARKILSIENSLVIQRMNGGIPFVLFRVPDVISSDNKQLWAYLLWLRSNKVKPVTVSNSWFTFSLIYSKDIAKSIAQILDLGTFIRDQAINLAYKRSFNLHSILIDMTKILRRKVDIHIDDRVTNFLPTSRIGTLDVWKMNSLLDIECTEWNTALRMTLNEMESLMGVSSPERDRAIHFSLTNIFAGLEERFLEEIETYYAINLNKFRHSLRFKTEL